MSRANSRSSGPQPSQLSAQCSRSAVAISETQRRLKHGRIRPMHEPSLIERLLGRC